MVRQADVKAVVQRALARDPRCAGSDIHVTVSKGVVRLTGWVGTAVMKQEAQEVTLAVEGVHDVANNLSMTNESTGMQMRVARHTAETDASLVQGARGVLTNDGALRALPTSISISHRRATLSGTADDWEQVRALDEQVRAVPGIEGVDTQVVPQSVHDAITAALVTSGTAVDGRIHFTMDGKTLTVEGTVSSWDERKAVLDAITRTGASYGIIDQLRVEPAG